MAPSVSHGNPAPHKAIPPDVAPGLTYRGRTYVRVAVEVRFWRKVEKSDGCWIWLGAKNNQGYGQLWAGGDDGRLVYAHRFSWELKHGPIPTGLFLDHLCRNRACVNPDHLEPVTNRENCLRGEAPHMVLHRLGVCARGHALTEGNVYVQPVTGWRHCRICRTADRRAYHERTGR